ncbi:MAG: WHG domain-containing protein [Oscillospiraceae bacterium]|nr:WHG domain-containing protein [Oscillospiraceae bacterium]
MPPKVKITKSDIINAAVEVVRRQGSAALNARTVAGHLNCSTQPIFSNYHSMEELKADVIRAAETLHQQFIRQETERGKYPPYKASGIAYVRFAKEERELFKLLFMRDRSGEKMQDSTEETEALIGIIRKNTGMTKEDACLFHLGMWVYVHGIATMVATSYLEWDWELISKMLTDAYEGMKLRYAKKG